MTADYNSAADVADALANEIAVLRSDLRSAVRLLENLLPATPQTDEERDAAEWLAAKREQ